MNGNRSGKLAEDVIADLLKRQGCTFIRQAVVGTSIFTQALRADFLVRNLIEYPNGLVIESKWQDRDGSVDEKLPYVERNIRAGNYGCPVVVVIAGGSCRPGPFAWLRRQVDGVRFVAVFSSVDELMSWLQRTVHVAARSPKLSFDEGDRLA